MTVTAHDELGDLEARITEAKQADRAAQDALMQAERAVEQARDQVREQHDLGADAAKQTRELQKAKAAVEEKGLAREGVSRRVARATADRDRFVEENALALLEELRPQAEQVTADMLAAAEALIAADAAWSGLQARVGQLLIAAHRSPRDDAPGDHELTGLVRELRRMSGEVRSPMPHGRVRVPV